MNPFVNILCKCLLSPRLYKIYKDGPQSSLYEPQGFEKWGDKIVASASALLNVTLYTSPFICLYIYKRGYFTYDEAKMMVRFLGGFSVFLAMAFLMRAYGRTSNPKYMKFLTALERQPKQRMDSYIAGIQKYDFDFTAWPASFNMPPSENRFNWLPKNPFYSPVNSDLPFYQRIPIKVLGFIATHTFALRLIYPGSLGLIHNLLWAPIFQGRTNMVETYNGQRAKLKTADNNFIDTMFVDNRWASTKGGTLVVCCEGNSGFYELGIMMSPIKAKYSALGWNHPGFGESTGLPYPSQEHNAIDAVLQYAIQNLEFDPENIVMFGWSIGGYSAAWAAVNYPVKALILDATFDDLLPLAQNQMPASWAVLVKEVVRTHVNLNIVDLLNKYCGPLQIVRRTDDEIICLRPGQCETNRCNNLMIELMKQRHPDIVEDSMEQIIRYANMPESMRPELDDDIVPSDHLFVLRHLRNYMRDYKSTHCTPLPDDMFPAIMETIQGPPKTRKINLA